MDGTLSTTKINEAHLFILWQSLGGSAEVVSRATGIRKNVIEALAHDYQWDMLAGGKLALQDKELEKKINRAQNYLQAVRLRGLLDSVMSHLTAEENKEKLESTIFTTSDKGEPKIGAKGLVELAKAYETLHNITYRALGDKEAESADTTSSDDEKIKSMSLNVYNLVNRAAIDNGMKPEKVVREHIKTVSGG
jgi:curved DNA-binding protein CbpA